MPVIRYNSYMSFRWYLIFMGVGTGLAWIAWMFVLQTTNPYESGFMGLAFFYITLMLSLVGTLSLLGIGYRIGIQKRNITVFREVRVSFRQAVILSLLAVFALCLGAQKHMTWYYLLALVALAGGIEYTMSVIQSARRE